MPNRALLHFTTDEIEYLLETGEIDKKFHELFEKAIEEAKAAPDGTAAVQFFVDYEPEEEDADDNIDTDAIEPEDKKDPE